MKIAIPFFKKKTEIPEKIFETGAIEAKDIIAPSSIVLSPDYLKLGKKFTKSFFIFSYPRYLTTAWFSPVINLDTPMDIGFHIHPVETGLILKQLRKKVTEVQAELAEREEKGLIRDPALETAFQDIETLRDRLQTAQERMFKLGLYLTIYGDSAKELKETEITLRSILESRLIYIKPALYQQRDGFHASSPSGLDQLQVHTPMNTEPLSSIFPFVSFDLSSNEGILYGVNRHNNSLILFDRFSLENANEVIFGKAGSGKSVRRDTPVLIKSKQTIQLTKIGPLVENLIKKYGATQIDEELEGVINPEVKVYSFDKNLKGKWSRVTVAARKKAPKIFYKFTTRGGREITTTGDHNMLVLKNGKVIAAKSSKIKEGEFVPLPREISSNQRELKYINLLKLLKNSKRTYVTGAQDLITENYKTLQNKGIFNLFANAYLYKRGRGIPMRVFWKILKCLSISSDDKRFKNLLVGPKTKRKDVNIYFPIIKEFLRIAGFITAEGTIKNDHVSISNTAPEILSLLKSSFRKLGIGFTEIKARNRIEGVVTYKRVFVEIANKLGGKGRAGDKKIWPFIFNLGKKQIAHYLSGYFEGDGGIDGDAISATSKSKRLISEIAYLLFYFGIIGRISKKKSKRPEEKREKLYYKITISGQDNLRKFAENINFITKEKREKLTEITQKQGNTNVDIIPEVQNIFKDIYQLFGPQLRGWKDWQNFTRDFSRIKGGGCNPSREKLREIISGIEQQIQKFKDLSSTLEIVSELPELATIIDLGMNNKELNGALWQTLGEGWRTIKSREHKPFAQNTLKAIQVINGNNYSLTEIKERIHLGFRKMGLPIKYYNLPLQRVLVYRKKNNCSYEMIQKAAQFVWQNYQKVLNENIPQVEEKLAQLKILVNSDLFWDPIVKIKKFENKKDKYVYDLTVDNEVFLAGQGGMFVHNSYAIKLEILRYLMAGTDVLVLDPENEYRFLSDAVGGSFFNISLASPNHINPFDLSTPREDEKAEDVLRSNVLNLVGLLRIMLGGLTPEEDAIIDQALTETYAAKDIVPETDPTLWSERIPLMQDFEAILEGMEGGESLVRRVRKFTKGTFAQFFNQPTNISMEKPFVVFGIRDMEDELRPMAMFIIMRYIWNKVRSELKKRILVVDEAWWLMQREDGASFLFGMAKRARKYWLGVTTVTQDVNDFMKSAYGQPIITNSSLQVLMKQSPATIEVVQKIFNLTEEEKYLLLEAEVGEGIFFAGQKHVAIKTVASYTEDQIITTAPEEVLKIREAKKELGR